MKICFETFGCRLNRAEALAVEARFAAAGHEIVSDRAAADMIVVRGCSVTARAERDCVNLLARLRHDYPDKRIVATGCLPKAEKLALPPRPGDAPAVPTRTARAYLKVQDGCAGACTFCIVPHYRGTSRSVPFGEVLDRAKRFVEAGYHEIVLTGCNLALYASEGKRLAELADALASVDANCRVRVGSVEPGGAAEDLVAAMAANANICRFLHLPVQSGSDRILAAMGRPYRLRDVERLLRRAESALAPVALGCDVMGGFPGESPLDHLATRGLLERHPFSNVHAFPYSERPGTSAATLPNPVAKDERARRAKELAAVGEEQRRFFARRFVGRTVDLVIERAHAFEGWSGEYLWCRAEIGPAARQRPPRRKDRATMRVTAAHGGVLSGVIG